MWGFGAKTASGRAAAGAATGRNTIRGGRSAGAGSGRTVTSGSAFGGIAGMQAASEQIRAENQQRRAAQSASSQNAGLLSGIQESLAGMVEQYNTAFDAANARNEERYAQLLESAGKESGQRATDIKASAQQNLATRQQQLARTGMSNIGYTLAQGAEREMQAELRREGDAAEKTKRGIIERRTDTGPDPTLLASAFQSIGSGFGGTGQAAALKALSGMRV